jgi:anti-sigma factor RsiW
MNDSASKSEKPCFTDFAIQEYIMGRLAEEIRREIEAHFHSCRECASCHNQYALERDFIVTLMSTSSDTPSGLCPSDETLARYLDSSLDDTEHTKCECHVAACADCRQELLDIYDDLQQLTTMQPQSDSPPKPTPQGLILRMPERKPGSAESRRIMWPIDEAESG